MVLERLTVRRQKITPSPSKIAAKEPRHYFASVLPGIDTPLPTKFGLLAKAVLEFERANDRIAWLLLHDDAGTKDIDEISDDLVWRIMDAQKEFESGKNLALILHTGGGDAHAAYRIATFF
jgi:hypothetical protein